MKKKDKIKITKTPVNKLLCSSTCEKFTVASIQNHPKKKLSQIDPGSNIHVQQLSIADWLNAIKPICPG